MKTMPYDFPEPFFNERVQDVLETLREPKQWDGQIVSEPDREELAFPITAFYAAYGLASTGEDCEKHIDFLWCYGNDPKFCARLLSVLTDYYQHPEKRTIGEMLADIVNAEKSSATRERHVKWVNGIPKLVIEVKSRHPTKWDAIACNLNDDLKLLRGQKVKGDTLRTSIFPNELKRRERILQKWSENIKAWGNLPRNVIRAPANL